MAAAFFMLAVDVWHTNSPVGLDRAAWRLGITAGEDGPLDGNARWAHFAESIGSRRGVALGAVALLGLALIWRDAIVALVALLAPVASFVMTEYFAKPLINAPIPYGGRMYPSGHAAGVAAVAVTALLLLYGHWGAVAAVLFAPLAVAAVAVVGLGVLRLNFHHYPTDIVGGATLGAAVALTLTAVLDAGNRRLPMSIRVTKVPN
jgi:membrane-associated phospholipid phosphatase